MCRISRLAVDAAAQRSEDRLRIPVNPVVMTRDLWRERDDELAADIAAGPTYSVSTLTVPRPGHPA